MQSNPSRRRFLALPLALCAASISLPFTGRDAQAAPANDNFANVQVLPAGTSFAVTGNNAGATTEAFEKANDWPPDVNANSVWYSFTPTISGYLTTQAFRTNDDPLLTAIFLGPAMPSKATYLVQDPVTGVNTSFHVDAGKQYFFYLADQAYPQAYNFSGSVTPEPTFFNGEQALSNTVYYLSFPNGNYFGYYAYLPGDGHYIYHFDLGYEYVFDGNDGQGGVYLYDFKSSDFFYTSPTFGFPYLYDFNLKATLYYYPDPNNTGRYNTNGVRYFYNYATGQIITK